MEYGHEVSSERSREEQTITEVRENECPICISSMASSMTITTRCLHTFCYDCLTRHINSTTNIGENRNRNRKCPCCREYLFDDEEQMEQIGPNELELTAVEIQDIVDYYIGDNNENEEPEIENINNNNQLNEENIIGWQYRNDNLENYYSNSNYIHQIPHQLPGRLEQIMNGQGLENVTLTRG